MVLRMTIDEAINLHSNKLRLKPDGQMLYAEKIANLHSNKLRLKPSIPGTNPSSHTFTFQ